MFTQTTVSIATTPRNLQQNVSFLSVECLTQSSQSTKRKAYWASLRKFASLHFFFLYPTRFCWVPVVFWFDLVDISVFIIGMQNAWCFALVPLVYIQSIQSAVCKMLMKCDGKKNQVQVGCWFYLQNSFSLSKWTSETTLVRRECREEGSHCCFHQPGNIIIFVPHNAAFLRCDIMFHGWEMCLNSTVQVWLTSTWENSERFGADYILKKDSGSYLLWFDLQIKWKIGLAC